MMQYENPYQPPSDSADDPDVQAQAEEEQTQLANGSYVGWHTFGGLVLGIIVAAVIQLAMLELPYARIGEQMTLVFWSLVMGVICAITGSVSGALMDTIYAPRSRKVNRPGAAPLSRRD